MAIRPEIIAAYIDITSDLIEQHANHDGTYTDKDGNLRCKDDDGLVVPHHSWVDEQP